MGLLNGWWNWRQGNADAMAGAANAGTAATMKALRGGLLNAAEREALVSTPAWAGDPGNVGGGLLMAGTFAGRGAKTADLVKLAQAEKMAAGGAGNEAIRAETGWFRGPEGKWRFEIPDQFSEYRPGALAADLKMQGMEGDPFAQGFRAQVGDALEHNRLFDAYPELRNMTFRVDPGLTPAGYNGMYSAFERNGVKVPSVALSSEVAPQLGTGHSTLLHELQHAVQDIEGFERGGTPAGMAASLPDAQALNDAKVMAMLIKRGTPPDEATSAFLNMMGRDSHPAARILLAENTPEQLTRMTADPAEAYRRLAGEVEARDVQARMNMQNSKRKATAPYSSQGIPLDQMIVRSATEPVIPGLIPVPREAKPKKPGPWK